MISYSGLLYYIVSGVIVNVNIFFFWLCDCIIFCNVYIRCWLYWNIGMNVLYDGYK